MSKLHYLGEYSSLEFLKATEKDSTRCKNACAYTSKEKKMYKYENGEWKENKHDSTIKMPVYELEKGMIESIGPMKNLTEGITIINNFYNKNNNQTYFMLLGKEISYYTVFKIETEKETYDFPSLGKGVIECLKNIGKIYSIEETASSDGVEIWIKASDTNEMTVLYLFPYDLGVCTIGG